MSQITEAVGQKIRIYRKKKKMTIEELALKICKSKATVSKYEKGEIGLDLDTLYEIADALDVNPEQLIISRTIHHKEESVGCPSFFRDVREFYGYFYDGRDKQIVKCLFEVISPLENQDNGRQRVRMYMNFKEYEQYQDCENTYEGYIEHYDAITNIILINDHLPMEKASIQLLASSLYASQRWGLWNGLSTRPLMPIATKILLSTHRIPENDEVLSQLKITNEDIKLFKLYNMFPVF